MSRELNVAIVGATGAVGETFLTVLEERDFPIKTLYPLASSRSVGKTVTFKNKQLDVLDLAEFDFSKVDIALFSAGGSVSKEYAPKAAASGCVVVDNSSCFRYEEDIPLVVPEVNPHRIAEYKNRGIIANPNCSTIQMVVVLKPLYDAAGITRINVATYQSVSGTGKKAISELVSQVGDLLNGRPANVSVYPQQIAFNAIPHIDQFEENGYTREEMKMLWETRKIMEDDSIMVNPTAVRVPVIYGHSEAIHLELKKPLTAKEARQILSKAPGIKVVDNNGSKASYPTAIKNAIGHDEVFVGRIRQDISHPNGLNLWVVADNIRKGAASNAVQIAEILQREYL
ncbi:aspartate-semialdehyde dehydrogenase [Legionella tucsonensis]|uniref:Aspartate-semialdehyde dehydrogenase n=1 Tax=Legionella tucsonensis TaxID=40335 RepID=A0A0W0ZXU2_9GAMM|nr:aspartate-semialdehyde dehydrogenase [Legionella tucsonensis]KTD73932.1 aspartate-semialdehyde dehydrogenase [Legionella tucsonensis]